MNFLVFLASLAFSLTTRLFLSPHTPPSTRMLLQKVATTYNLILADVSSASDLLAGGYQQEVALDYIHSEPLSIVLESLAEHEFRYISMWERSGDTARAQQSLSYTSAFSEYLSNLNFTQVMLISDSQPSNLHSTADIMKRNSGLYRNLAIVPTAASEGFCLDFVGRMIKPRGINFVALFTDEISAFHFLSALEAHKMNKAGYAFILSQEASFYRYVSGPTSMLHISGVIVIADSPAEAVSFPEYHLAMLLATLQSVSSAGRIPTYSLYSVINGKLRIAASTPTNYISPILFPGNSTHVPRYSKAEIKVSVNYDIKEPDGATYASSPIVMRGYQVAIDDINVLPDILPDYVIKNYSVDFTGSVFDFNVTKNRVMKNIEKVGLAYMSTEYSQAVIGTFAVLSDLNLTVPITGSSPGPSLSDNHQFPLYVRTRVSNEYVLTIMCRTIRGFGWRSLAVLYQDDMGDFQETYDLFVQLAKDFKIDITNPAEYRRLPNAISNSSQESVTQSIRAITSSDTRVILLLHNFHYLVLDRMFELGVRQGYVFLLTAGLDDLAYSDPRYANRRIVSKGALMFSSKVFDGQIGLKVRERLMKYDKNVYFSSSCLNYDAAMLYFHATDFLLEHGRDYEDPFFIIDSMRGTRFIGCSGLVKIESGRNDRVSSVIMIVNFQYDNIGGNYTIKTVGSYNPYVADSLRLTDAIQWPDDGITYEERKPRYKGCPYLFETVTISEGGKMIAMVMCFAVIVSTAAVSAIVWRRWWNAELVMLRSKQLISIEDTLMFLSVACEYFQFATLAPDLNGLSTFVATKSAAFSVNIEDVWNMENGVYWIVLDFVLSTVAIWVVVCALKLSGLDSRVTQVCGSFEYWTELLMPLFGNLLFFPIVSTLMNVFVCYKGVSQRLTDSFLSKDCNQFCWRGKHLGYAIGGGLALLSYIPLATFTRPLWQELQSNAHVKASSVSLMVKSVVQVFLIACAHTLKPEFPSLHAYIYFSTLVCYIAYIIAWKQFNYDRLNLWYVCIIASVLFLSLFSFLAYRFPKHSSLFLICAIAGSLVVTFSGLIIQRFVPRFASLLFREKKDVTGLFTFAFTVGDRATTGLEHFYATNKATSTKDSITRRRDTPPQPD